jgi:hypothetical protein
MMSNQVPLIVFAAASGILLVHDPFAPADFFFFFPCRRWALYLMVAAPALTTPQRARRPVPLRNRLE